MRQEESRQLLEAGKGKEIDSSLEPPEWNAVHHLDLNLVRTVLVF